MELVRKQLHYSVPFGVASSMNVLFQRFDKIICITFLTPAEFAVYAIAFYGIPGMMQVFDTLAQVYIVQMTVKYQDNKTNELSELYKTLVTKIYSFSLPALLIVMLYAKKIIALLFTSNYLDAVPLFRAYLLSIPVFMLSGGIILRAMGKTTYNLRSYLIAGVFILPLTYFLIKYVGIWGAMIGALISIALPKFLNLAAEIKLLKLRFTNFFPWKNFATITLISLISVIPFLALEYWFDYGIIVSALLGILYIIIVSMLELKYDLFPMASDSVKNKLRPYLGLIRLYSPENRK
jgi:O-antigen/teichoic acid export membrane protein